MTPFGSMRESDQSMISSKTLDHITKSGVSVAYTTSRAADEAFIQLAVRAGRDTRLKLSAKGLLWELLTYHDDELPSDEEIYWAHRESREAQGLKSDGLASIRGALDDLERWGYLVRLRIQDAQGHPRSVRAVTDSPGHHKLDVPGIYEQAQKIPVKAERLDAERVLLKQQDFPRGAHTPGPGSIGSTKGASVISLAERRAARAG